MDDPARDVCLDAWNVMSRYERFAVIFDPEGTGLGVEALGLIERGIDPLYAKDLDEALQLAEQEEERVGAFVLPGTLPAPLLDSALERATPLLWAGAAAILLVAPPRDRALLRGLRDRGIRWVLFAPYEPAELRFAVAAALCSEDDLDPRGGLRVPIRLDARITTEKGRCLGQIRNLSLGGAYVAMPDPPPVDARITLEVSLGERPVQLAARVCHSLSVALSGRAEREPGIGIRYQLPAESELRAIHDFLRERIDSFRLVS
jgi:hypothetical protein